MIKTNRNKAKAKDPIFVRIDDEVELLLKTMALSILV